MVVSSLDGSVTSTSSQANNLLSYAMGFDSFRNSDFIIFNDSEYSYYIVWGDLKNEDGTIVSDGAVEYIRYYRTSSSGYSSSYSYEVGNDEVFSLSLSEEYICTTSVAESGFVSSTYLDYRYKQGTLILFMFILAMVFAIMVKSFRGFKS